VWKTNVRQGDTYLTNQWNQQGIIWEIGKPKSSKKYTEKDLSNMGLVGLYWIEEHTEK